MIKDKFEIEIGKRLQSTEAPVPAGSWAAIKAGIKTPPAATPSGSPVSGSGFIVGLAAATLMLVSLVVYSGNEPAHSNDSEAVTIEQPATEPAKSPVTVVQKAETESESVTSETTQEEITTAAKSSAMETPAVAEPVQSEAVFTPRESIVGKPIDSNGISEIQEQKAELRKKKVLQENKIKEDVNGTEQNESAPVAKPKANITANKVVGYAPLTVNFGNKGEGEKFYWEFGYMAESDDKAPEVIFEEAGVYTVFLTVENSKGEMDEDFVEITVKEGSKFYVQDAFTPNGDGTNDKYKIEGASNIEEFYMIITDENGKSVFETRDLNRGWEYDQSVHGRNGAKYFVSYRAIGVDGKVYTEDRKPIHVLY